MVSRCFAIRSDNGTQRRSTSVVLGTGSFRDRKL
jgi:hypothetical protein